MFEIEDGVSIPNEIRSRLVFQTRINSGECEDVLDLDISFFSREVIFHGKNNPFSLEKIGNLVELYFQHNQNVIDKQEICFGMIFKEFPRLALYLYQAHLFQADFIIQEIKKEYQSMQIILFKEYIDELNEFSKYINSSHKKALSFIDNRKQVINDGWKIGEIGYILKFDDIDSLKEMEIPKKDHKVVWSIFEWINSPADLSLLSVSACFSSLKCFRHLLINGFSISKNVIMGSIYGGNLDIFHLCVPFIDEKSIEEFAFNSSVWRKNEIAEWIILNYNVPLSIFVHSNNLYFVLYLIQNGYDLNLKKEVILRFLKEIH